MRTIVFGGLYCCTPILGNCQLEFGVLGSGFRGT